MSDKTEQDMKELEEFRAAKREAAERAERDAKAAAEAAKSAAEHAEAKLKYEQAQAASHAISAEQKSVVVWHDYRNFMKAAMVSLASNPYFFQSGGGVSEREVVGRLATIANAMWLQLPSFDPQALQPGLGATPPSPQPVAYQAPPQGQVAPIPNAAQPAGTGMPAYTPLPGFVGGSQQVSVGGMPNVQGQHTPMGATVPSPHGGGVGSGMPYQQPMPAGQQVKVVAENYAGQNLGPGSVPSAVQGQQVHVHNPVQQAPGRF